MANENQKLTLNINEILIDIPQKYVYSLALKTHLKNWNSVYLDDGTIIQTGVAHLFSSIHLHIAKGIDISQ